MAFLHIPSYRKQLKYENKWKGVVNVNVINCILSESSKVLKRTKYFTLSKKLILSTKARLNKVSILLI